jgi:hypothetical protein
LQLGDAGDGSGKAGGGATLVTNTLNSFFNESSLRPPSGVPVMAT